MRKLLALVLVGSFGWGTIALAGPGYVRWVKPPTSRVLTSFSSRPTPSPSSRLVAPDFGRVETSGLSLRDALAINGPPRDLRERLGVPAPPVPLLIASGAVSVSQLQLKLSTHGIDVGTVDGVWGWRTSDGVRAFQQHYNRRHSGGLDIDGVLGPRTWAALEASCDGLARHRHGSVIEASIVYIGGDAGTRS